MEIGVGPLSFRLDLIDLISAYNIFNIASLHESTSTAQVYGEFKSNSSET